MSDWKQEVLAFFTRWWLYLCYILIGIVTKFSYDLVKKKKISFLQAIGSTGIAGFLGFLATLYCVHKDLSTTLAGIIVPLATILSDKIFTWLFTRDWGKMLDGIYENLRDKV